MVGFIFIWIVTGRDTQGSCSFGIVDEYFAL